MYPKFVVLARRATAGAVLEPLRRVGSEGKAQPSLQNPDSRGKAELDGGLKYLRKLNSNQIYAGFTQLPFLLVFHKIEMMMEEKFIVSPRYNIVFPWKKAEQPCKPRNVYGGLFQTAASQLALSLSLSLYV